MSCVLILILHLLLLHSWQSLYGTPTATATCRPVSLFELLGCHPSICSFLRLCVQRKATVNSEFTKERASRKQRGVKCVISSQQAWQLKKEEERREGRAESGWISNKKYPKRLLYGVFFLNYLLSFIFILPFDLLFLPCPHPQIHSSINWYNVNLIN